MPKTIIRISPSEVLYKLRSDLDLKNRVEPGDWDLARRVWLHDTVKYRAVVERFINGAAWEDTHLFKKQYSIRFGLGGSVRNFQTIESLAAHYYEKYDAMFAHMQAHGFVTHNGTKQVDIPHVHLCRDGYLALGNNGNHRIAMAKVLDLDHIYVELRSRHTDAPEERFHAVDISKIPGLPSLHDGATEIPAMTSLDERMAYYRIAKANAKGGAVVELGTWLGAATVFIAAGVRDAGQKKLHVYDRFQWTQIYKVKANSDLSGPMVEKFKENLGPLLPMVVIHEGNIMQQKWSDGPIDVLFMDAPKKLRNLHYVLCEFGQYMDVGGVLSLQDFAYFPAYELVAAMDVMEKKGFVKFTEAVLPTTAVFEVAKKWSPNDLQVGDYACDKWEPKQIIRVWDKWSERIPDPRFPVGGCMLLYDRGAVDTAVERFKPLAKLNEVQAKFSYMKQHRPEMVQQYAGLFAVL